MEDCQESKTILIIDDSKTQVAYLETLVSNLGLKVNTAFNGNTGMKLIEECRPDIVILDVMLPDINGLEILKKVKSNAELSDILMVLVSAKSDEDTVIQSLSLGANDFIRKPFDMAELRLKIRNLVKLKSSDDKIKMLNHELNKEKEKIQSERDLLAKYFSKDLINGILNGEISTKLGGEIRTASILFCDLRNSTGISESIDPNQFSKFLNNLFTDLTDIIYGESGSVNKFLGDGILATFGCPRMIENDALHCAQTALKIRKYLTNFNQFKPKYLQHPIEMGIGIARGELFTGNIGSVNQIQYTVLGDPVNIASRLESLTKLARVDILIDGKIRDELANTVKVKRVKFSQVRGKIKEVEIYSLEDIINS